MATRCDECGGVDIHMTTDDAVALLGALAYMRSKGEPALPDLADALMGVLGIPPRPSTKPH